ncbi:bifunctional purine biosynthesis protein PurH [Candidatus Magnetoovum chiemensis]|nr:bifunctional purine biosynthesis protein PurH [Candidatus Magnetoovum chiemensis]
MTDIKKMYKTIMDDNFPDEISINIADTKLVYKKRTWKIKDDKTGELVEKGLRYGENPDQEAALYELTGGNLKIAGCQYIEPHNGLVSAITENEMLQSGKHPGKTNLTDLDNALNIMKYLMDKPTAIIIKHNNPCGIANGNTISTAYDRANRADRIAAFGGCLALNRPVDKQTAELISSNYLEVVAAPDYEDGTLEIISKRKNLRIIRLKQINELKKFIAFKYLDFKSLMDGSIIIQQSQTNKIRTKEDFQIAKTIYKGKEYKIERTPTEKEYEDMLFGWHVEHGISSNSVIYVKDGATVGIGTGEQDRVGVAEIAAFKAYTKYADSLCFEKYGISYKDFELEVQQGRKNQDALTEIDEQTKKDGAGLIGSVMVSDAFFPFRDGIDVGLKAGVSAIVQPGGSDRDLDAITACNETIPKTTMVFTMQRVFKH